DSRRGLMPLETAEHVVVTARLAPARQYEIGRELVTRATAGDRAESLLISLAEVPALMAILPIRFDRKAGKRVGHGAMSRLAGASVCGPRPRKRKATSDRHE